jgi:cell division protein FtsB
MTEAEPTSRRATLGDALKATGTSSAGRGRRLLRHLLLLVTAAILIDAIAGEKGLLALLEARRQFQAVQQSLDDVRALNAALREQARRLREDPSAIEEEARRELGLLKPGEVLFIIKDAEQK